MINEVAAQLGKNYPGINLRVHNQNTMTIFPKDENGFEIVIQSNDSGYVIYFGKWHLHFEKTEEGKNELLDYLGFGMSKFGRLKVHSKNGAEYKWTFEILNQLDGKWYPAGTMGTVNLKFWQKEEIKYFQNDLISFDNPDEKNG